MAGAKIVRLFAPDYDFPLDKRGQFAAYRRARTEIEQKELLQRQRLFLLFCVSDLDADVEIDNGL